MLSGERVLLRPIERADLPRLWELVFGNFEVEVLSSAGPVLPLSLARYQATFEEQVADPPKDQLWLAIETGGELIGECGLYAIDHYSQRCELGISLGTAHWGKGFGQDAVRTLVDYAFTHLNMNRVALKVLADDARAVGAYRRAGFVEEGRLRQQARIRGRFADELVMSILRDD